MKIQTQQYNIGGFVIPVITRESCFRAMQYMKREPITCSCSNCLVVNAGMSNEQIRARMDKAYVR
jgi:hypothetical protein